MRILLIAFGMLSCLVVPASAGFERWTADTEDDPFSKGKRVTVDFMTSIRSGVLLICDSSEKGFLLRAVPGFVFNNSDMSDVEPEVEIAIDGQRLFGQKGEIGSVGDNLAVSQFMLSPKNAKAFLAAFTAAKKQVAIKDGISDRPYLLSARGSSKAAVALESCLSLQHAE